MSVERGKFVRMSGCYSPAVLGEVISRHYWEVLGLEARHKEQYRSWPKPASCSVKNETMKFEDEDEFTIEPLGSVEFDSCSIRPSKPVLPILT